MKQTIKINESQLRQIIRESIADILEESIIISNHRMAPNSNVYYGEDEMGFFAVNYLRNIFRRFPNERQAREFAEMLRQQEITGDDDPWKGRTF